VSPVFKLPYTLANQLLYFAQESNCYWRQWRKPRIKVRALIKLGVTERLAIACGITSKGPCRSSKTKVINIAISNAFLEQQGLLSLREMWIKIQYS
jgi:RNA-directed DNA polymerase